MTSIVDSFTKKRIKAVITLNSPSGGFQSAGGANQVTLEGYRIIADIQKAGGMSMGTANFRIYGLRQQDMNQLTQLSFHPLEVRDNSIEIFAGDEKGLTSIYFGTILAAFGNYQSAPEVALEISAMAGYFNKINPIDPVSYQGSMDAATTIKTLVEKMGYSFENSNNLHVNLADGYYDKTGIDQVIAMCQNAGIDFYLDDRTFAICPKGVARKISGQIPLIDKNSGMVGYPSFDKMGVSVQTVFRPDILFGGSVQLKSEVQTANGTWRVVSLSHDLESEKPFGRWFTNLWVTDTDLPVIVPS